MHHVQPTAPIPSPNLLIAAALALSPARSELALIGLGLGRTFCYSRAEYPIRPEIKTRVHMTSTPTGSGGYREVVAAAAKEAEKPAAPRRL